MTSSIWPTRTLAEIASQVQYGYTAKSSSEEVGPHFLRITDIVPNLIDWSDVPFCEIDPESEPKYRLSPGDIVIARTGATVGYAKHVGNPPPSVFASYLVRVRVDEGNDSRYVGFVVESSDYKRFIKAHAGGAAQPNANAKILTSYPVPVPPFDTQRKIASVLSSYDDLITNNTRRIEVLEEMARAIYREWFVEFRYPGHEGVPLVESELGPVPAGWGAARLDEISTQLPVGKRFDTKTVSDTGAVPVLDQSRDGCIGWHDEEPGVIASVDRPVFTFANHTCAMRLVTKPFSVIQNVFPKIGTAGMATTLFAYHAGRNRQRSEEYKGHHPRWRETRVPLASMSVQESFTELVQPMHHLQSSLVDQQRALLATRDLLLPKLVSGEVDVSDLEIDVGAVA